MAYHESTLAELAEARARGQKPDGFVIVGGREARDWALRNRFFYVDSKDCGIDLTALAGLDVVLRSHDPNYALAALISMFARFVTVFDTETKTANFL